MPPVFQVLCNRNRGVSCVFDITLAKLLPCAARTPMPPSLAMSTCKVADDAPVRVPNALRASSARTRGGQDQKRPRASIAGRRNGGIGGQRRVESPARLVAENLGTRYRTTPSNICRAEVRRVEAEAAEFCLFGRRCRSAATMTKVLFTRCKDLVDRRESVGLHACLTVVCTQCETASCA